MRSPTQLSLPGLVVLIIVALALAYFERQGGDEQASAPQERSAPRTAPDARPAREAKVAPANATGDFDYYSLVLSWSPTHCETPEGQDDHQQCGRGRRYGFIVHGLWPQHARGYPENCPTQTRPYVPQSVIDGMMDIMPSKGLIIHEYRKHGTCSGLSPEEYFATTRRLRAGLKIPDRFRNPVAMQSVSPADVIGAFVSANPQLDRSMLAVGCRGKGNRLREVRICYSKAGKPQACGSNENQRQLCRSDRMDVPPVR